MNRAISLLLRPSLRQGAVVLVDQGFCSLANFLTGWLVARACVREEYGLYVLGFSVLATAQGVQASLSGTPFTVLSPGLERAERKRYFGCTLLQHGLLSAVVISGLLGATTVLAYFGRSGGFDRLILALSAATAFVLLRDFLRYVLLAEMRVWLSLSMGLAANLTIIGLLLGAYRASQLNAVTAYYIVAGCSAVPAVFVLLLERPSLAVTRRQFAECLSDNWRFGKWLVARMGAFFVATQSYVWILAIVGGKEAVAILGACMLPVSLVNPLLLGVSRFIGPKAARAACDSPAQVKRVVYGAMLLLLPVLLGLVLLLYVFADDILRVLYQGKYDGFGYLVVLLGVRQLIAAVGSPLDSGLDGLRRPVSRFRADVLGGFTGLLVGIPSILTLGVFGAPFGMCVCHTVRRVYLWVVFRRATAS